MLIRTRSLAQCAKDIGMSKIQIARISAKNNWVSRCADYDLYLDEKIRAQNELEIIEMRKNHMLLASQMIKKAARRLLTMPEAEITASDIVRFIDVGVKIERLSRGEFTEHKQISGETKVTHLGRVKLDFSGMSDEELDEFEKLLEQLHKLNS